MLTYTLWHTSFSDVLFNKKMPGQQAGQKTSEKGVTTTTKIHPPNTPAD